MINYLEKLPYFVSHFLGYRKPDHKQKVLRPWKIYFWSFLAAWIGIAILEIIFTYGPSFQARQAPMIVASYGASAVLIFGVIDSPLAQPRNVMCGQLIGAIVGVIISQLFLGIKQTWEDESQRVAVEWVSGATAMALALVVMQVTKTVHPPGGATALIPAVTPSIMDIKWFYIGVVALSSLMQITVACLVNNVERKYPQYWWTPRSLPLQMDPATLATVMSTHNDPQEEIVADNFTQAEEGRLDRHFQHKSSQDSDNASEVAQGITSRSSSSTIFDSTQSIDKAISVLQKRAGDSHLKYVLISPGLPLIATPGLLTNTEKRTLDILLQKLSQAPSPIIY